MTPRARKALRMVIAPRALVAALWAVVELRRVRRHLTVGDVARVAVQPPPAGVSDRWRDAVRAVLRLGRATCLQRSLILQAWDCAHGRGRAVVIGVTTPSTGFRAHAWLDGEGGCDAGQGFHEFLRIEA